MSLDFTIFLKHQLRLTPIWPGVYNPIENITICQCPRKKYCPSPAKHAMMKEWYDTPVPTDSENTISQIENSNCNFAIVTGILPNDPETQLIIIDVDEPAMNLPEIQKLPTTLTVATPNNGLHFYYFLPSSIKIKNLSTGYVDIRAEHGYALCPPSKRYRFVPTSLDTITSLEELPSIPRRERTQATLSSSNHTPYGTHDGLIPCGERDAYVFHELITLCNAGLSLNQLLSQADRIHSQLEQPPKDPYTITDIRKKADYVYDRYSDPDTQALREAMDLYFPPHQ